MPFYEYVCDHCKHEFTQFNKIADRGRPTHQPCSQCGTEGTISQKIGAPVMSDPIRMGLRKTDSGFKEVMEKIHRGVAGSNLDKSGLF